jgi:hypothetical protein
MYKRGVHQTKEKHVSNRTNLVQKAMEQIGLSQEQAIEYIMEREYNHMSHSQAMKEIKSKKWLWEDTCPCCDSNPCLESLDAQNNHGDY